MLSTDFRQFGVKHILAGMFWVSVAVALLTNGLLTLWVVGVGMLCSAVAIVALFASDAIDSRPIDDRNFISAGFNLIGILLLVISLLLIVGGVVYFFAACLAGVSI